MNELSTPWYFVAPDTLDYREAQELQVRIVAARKSGTLEQDVLFLLEHPAVFTLGRRGGRENLTTSAECLAQAGIQVVPTERGGNITYHGPGQLVGYPIIDLNRTRMRVVDFVTRLEEVMIRSVGEWGLEAVRDPRNRGVWTAGMKLGSIGIAVRRGISFHGFALNVSTNLEHFKWIHPCGLTGVEMTSMADQGCPPPSMSRFKQTVVNHFCDIFGATLKTLSLSELEKFLAMP